MVDQQAMMKETCLKGTLGKQAGCLAALIGFNSSTMRSMSRMAVNHNHNLLGHRMEVLQEVRKIRI